MNLKSRILWFINTLKRKISKLFNWFRRKPKLVDTKYNNYVTSQYEYFKDELKSLFPEKPIVNPIYYKEVGVGTNRVSLSTSWVQTESSKLNKAISFFTTVESDLETDHRNDLSGTFLHKEHLC